MDRLCEMDNEELLNRLETLKLVKRHPNNKHQHTELFVELVEEQVQKMNTSGTIQRDRLMRTLKHPLTPVLFLPMAGSPLKLARDVFITNLASNVLEAIGESDPILGGNFAGYLGWLVDEGHVGLAIGFNPNLPKLDP